MTQAAPVSVASGALLYRLSERAIDDKTGELVCHASIYAAVATLA